MRGYGTNTQIKVISFLTIGIAISMKEGWAVMILNNFKNPHIKHNFLLCVTLAQRFDHLLGLIDYIHIPDEKGD